MDAEPEKMYEKKTLDKKKIEQNGGKKQILTKQVYE